jgi:hypothetical protein
MLSEPALRGDQDLPVGTSAIEDGFVGRCPHAGVADVHGVMPSRLQRVGQKRPTPSDEHCS